MNTTDEAMIRDLNRVRTTERAKAHAWREGAYMAADQFAAAVVERLGVDATAVGAIQQELFENADRICRERIAAHPMVLEPGNNPFTDD